MPLTDNLLHLALQYGRPEERQLLSRWHAEIRQFLTPFERGLRSGQQGLEIGLEPRLTLKLIIKRRTHPPVGGLLQLADNLPSGLAQVAAQAIATGKDFHVGLRINPASIHREIYLYDQESGLTSFLPPLPSPPEGRIISFYGVDELQGISAYCTNLENPPLYALLLARHIALNEALKINLDKQLQGMWLHYRLDKGLWSPQKFGLEYRSVPLAATMRALSHFKPPYFSYLIPRQATRQMVIGGATGGIFGAFYFMVI